MLIIRITITGHRSVCQDSTFVFTHRAYVHLCSNALFNPLWVQSVWQSSFVRFVVNSLFRRLPLTCGFRFAALLLLSLRRRRRNLIITTCSNRSQTDAGRASRQARQMKWATFRLFILSLSLLCSSRTLCVAARGTRESSAAFALNGAPSLLRLRFHFMFR